jgi:hypothetical protein
MTVRCLHCTPNLTYVNTRILSQMILPRALGSGTTGCVALPVGPRTVSAG